MVTPQSVGRFFVVPALSYLAMLAFHKLTAILSQNSVSELLGWVSGSHRLIAQVILTELIASALIALPVSCVIVVLYHYRWRFTLLMLCFSPLIYERVLWSANLLINSANSVWTNVPLLLAFISCLPAVGYMMLTAIAYAHQKKGIYKIC